VGVSRKFTVNKDPEELNRINLGDVCWEQVIFILPTQMFKMSYRTICEAMVNKHERQTLVDRVSSLFQSLQNGQRTRN